MFESRKRGGYMAYKFRSLLMEKTKGCCGYCGVELDCKNITIDHIEPVCNGGGNEVSNLMPCCRSCNCMKSSNSLEDFRKLLSFKCYEYPKFSFEQIKFLEDYKLVNKIFPDGYVEFYYEELQRESKNHSIE